MPFRSYCSINYEDRKQKDAESSIQEWSTWVDKSCVFVAVKLVVLPVCVTYVTRNGTINERKTFSLKTIKVMHTWSRLVNGYIPRWKVGRNEC
jgi:hypothetical protein